MFNGKIICGRVAEQSKEVGISMAGTPNVVSSNPKQGRVVLSLLNYFSELAYHLNQYAKHFRRPVILLVGNTSSSNRALNAY